MKRGIVVGLGLVAGLGAAGCTREAASSAGSAPRPAQSAPAAAPAQAEREQAASAKQAAYVECYNLYSREVSASLRGYLAEVDRVKGPTGKEKGRITLAEISDPLACTARMEGAKAQPPSLAGLERVGDRLSIALGALYPLLKDGHAYYDAGKQRADKAAHGRELHQKLMPAFDAAKNALQSLGDELDRLEDEHTGRELAALAGEPTARARYLSGKVMATAKQVVKAAGAKTLAGVDVDKLGPALSSYAAAVEELKAHCGQKKAECDAVALSPYVDKAAEYLESARTLERRARDHVAFTSAEQAALETQGARAVAGAPGQVVALYNELVEASNRLRWPG